MRRFRARAGAAASRFAATVRLSGAICDDVAIAGFGEILLGRLHPAGVSDLRTMLARDGRFDFQVAPSASTTDGSAALFAGASDGRGTWVVNLTTATTGLLLRTVDGSSWASQAEPFALSLLEYVDRRLFIAVGRTFAQVATSPTGETWTLRTGAAIAGDPYACAGGAGRIVIVGINGTTLVGTTSTDGGVSWSVLSFPALGGAVFNVLGLAYDATRREWLLHLETAVGNLLVVSGDGVTWSVDAAFAHPAVAFIWNVAQSATGYWYSIATATGGAKPIVSVARDGRGFAPAFTLSDAAAAPPLLEVYSNGAGSWACVYQVDGQPHTRLAHWQDGAAAPAVHGTLLDEIPSAAAEDSAALPVFVARVPLPESACRPVAGGLRVRIA